MFIKSLAFVFIFLLDLSLACSKLNICYYTSWTGVQPDAKLCTHIIYSFADMSGGQLSGVWSNPLSYLRSANPSIKLLIAVGGWNFGVGRMTEMMATQETRQRFVRHAVTYLRQLDFDGLDLDFEYPGTDYPQYGRYSPPEDKIKFTLLCEELRAAFESESRTSGKPRLLLTVAFGCRKLDIERGYEIAKLANHIDFFNLMTYDLRGGFDSIASHHSALYAGSYEENEDRVFNMDWAVNYFLNNGAPAHKLVLGLASYGKSFRWSTSEQRLGAPATFADWHSYSQTCSLVKSSWKREWVQTQGIPFAINGNTLIGYDDVQSIRLKAEYALKKSLAGVMWWSLDHDDHSGSCGEGRFPLINEVNKVFSNGSCSSSTNDDEFECGATIFVRHPTNCSMFIKCSTELKEFSCPNGLLFNFKKQRCDFALNVECLTQSTTTSSVSMTTTIETTTMTTTSTTTTTTTTTTLKIDLPQYNCELSGKNFVRHENECGKFIKCSTKQVITCPSNLMFSFDKQLCDFAQNVVC